MAFRYAVASGLWSSTSTWDGGTTVPTASDQVFANGQNIIIDTNATAEYFSNQATGSTAIGGSFIMLNGVTVTATTSSMGFRPYQNPASASLMIISGSNSATMIGSLYSMGASTTQGVTVTISGSANLTITGSISGNSLTNARGITHTSTGTLRILGNVYSGPSQGGVNLHDGITLLNTGTTIIQGNIYSYNPGGTPSCAPIRCSAAHTLIITGSLYTDEITLIVNTTGNGNIYISGSIIPYAGNNRAISKTTAGILEVIGPIIGNTAVVSTSTTATNRFTGPFIPYLSTDLQPVVCPRITFISSSSPYMTYSTNTIGQNISFYDTSYTSSVPASINVRSGSLYGSTNQFSGSMVVPSTSSVRYGVPVDTVTGSAVLTPQDILNFNITNLTGSNTIGARLKNISTLQTIAATIAAFKGK